MTSLLTIEKVGPANAEKLRSAGAGSVEALLVASVTPAGRKHLAEKTGITEHILLEWANRADLFRIRGIGEEYSDLLEIAGVDTVIELAARNPEHLHQKLVEINDATRRVRRLPSSAQVADWVAQAKKLPRLLVY